MLRSMLAGGGSWRAFRARIIPPRPTLIRPSDERLTTAPPDRAPPQEAGYFESLVGDVLASCPDPLFVVDRGGLVEQMNPAASEIQAGLALGSTRGLRIQEILRGVRLLTSDSPAAPFDAPRVGDLPSLVAAEEAPRGQIYDLRISPRTDSDRRLGGYIVQLVNVTPLLMAMRRTETARRHRDGILTLLSHDLRSPHAAILATVNHPDLAGAPSHLRQIIERAARRSLNMVDSLVRSVRAEIAEIDFQDINLEHLLEDVADSLWTRANDSKTVIQLELGNDAHPVSVDRGMISQAIADTLNSFIAFGLPGQPILCRLSRGALKGVPAATCEVTGTVRQVSDGELARIFSRFATSPNGEVGSLGDSVGLELARKIVKRHGGEVTCVQLDSARRTIALSLPLTASSSADEEETFNKPEAA